MPELRRRASAAIYRVLYLRRTDEVLLREWQAGARPYERAAQDGGLAEEKRAIEGAMGALEGDGFEVERIDLGP